MAVPLSPAELACKQRAFNQHETQLGKSAGSVVGDTSRQFDALGLPDYEAIETFHR